MPFSQCAALAPCSADASCADQPGGGYNCTCNAGYAGDGKTCSDVDECTAGTAICDANASCTNTPGGYNCTCNAGYAGDGKTCSDVDECAAGTAICDANASCTDSPGGYNCTCNAGFIGDGVTGCTPLCSLVDASVTLGSVACAGDALTWSVVSLTSQVAETIAVAPASAAAALSRPNGFFPPTAVRDRTYVSWDAVALSAGAAQATFKPLCNCADYSFTDATAALAQPVPVAAGGAHSCAIVAADGRAVCFGYGGDGRLGTGSDSDELSPANVTGLGSAISAIAAGSEHTCAIKTNGVVVCWQVFASSRARGGDFE